MISFCPICQAKQDAVEVKILETTDLARLLHLHCKKCEAGILALVVVSPAGLNSVGMITDLSAAEVVKFKDDNDLTVDEVLSFHEFNSLNKSWLKEMAEEDSLVKA